MQYLASKFNFLFCKSVVKYYMYVETSTNFTKYLYFQILHTFITKSDTCKIMPD